MSLEPMAQPEPAAPDDVVVAVEAAAVGWVDLIMASGQYQHMVAPPYTPGLEYAGTVAAMGEAVTGVAIGDRVLVDGFLAGRAPRARTSARGASPPGPSRPPRPSSRSRLR